MTATLDPPQPAAGEPVTVTIVVRNDGERTAEAVGLTDEVSRNAAIRSAVTPTGDCDVTSRRAECRLGSLEPGDSATATIRLLVDKEPASPTVAQQITLAADEQTRVTERGVSTLISNASAAPQLLNLPGPMVTLIALVGFVLAARS